MANCWIIEEDIKMVEHKIDMSGNPPKKEDKDNWDALILCLGLEDA
jgi:hypothetical protein